ncbi:MAG: FAD-binding protein, partial [Clostridiales bacterium]|nr:FAD-binding protein [Clostridiales bacterium]
MDKVKVVGAGLAGCECALYLASQGISVDLYDLKPKSKTPAHKSDDFAELVCSNSLKSNDIYGNAAGLLK